MDIGAGTVLTAAEVYGRIVTYGASDSDLVIKFNSWIPIKKAKKKKTIVLLLED